MNKTILIAAMLLTCTSAQALTDAEIRDVIYQTQRDQDRSVASQERFTRESNDGYDRLQREFDRETIRNEQRRLDDNYWHLDKRNERKGY